MYAWYLSLRDLWTGRQNLLASILVLTWCEL